MGSDRFFKRAVGLRRLCVLGLLLWLAAGTVKTYPFYLAYFNELTGGPGNGYKYLTDSNLDWGQDLKGLRVYLHRNGIAMVRLAYFGSVDPRAYGIAYERVRPGEPATGYIAVSATMLTGTFHYPSCEGAFDWLQRFRPIAKIGDSIFVYYVSPTQKLPPGASLPDCHLYDALMGGLLRPAP